jgi:hypothetical protein
LAIVRQARKKARRVVFVAIFGGKKARRVVFVASFGGKK